MTNQTTFELVRRRRIPYLRSVNLFYAVYFYCLNDNACIVLFKFEGTVKIKNTDIVCMDVNS